MHIHIYIYIHVYIFIFIYTDIYIYTCIHTYTYVHIHIYTHIYVYTYTCIRTYIPIYVCNTHLAQKNLQLTITKSYSGVWQNSVCGRLLPFLLRSLSLLSLSAATSPPLHMRTEKHAAAAAATAYLRGGGGMLDVSTKENDDKYFGQVFLEKHTHTHVHTRTYTYSHACGSNV